MTRSCGTLSSLSVVLAILIACPPPLVAAPAEPARWQPATRSDVKSQVLALFDAKRVDSTVRVQAEALLDQLPENASEDALLACVTQAYALVDPNAAKLLAQCSQPRSERALPEHPWLLDGSVPALFAANFRLLYARWLIHESLYEEALEQLSGLMPGEVVAPASLLFYQSVVSHALLNKESGLKSLDELLQGAESSPRRYVALARLMQEDLKGLENNTLDHIARRMEDIRRRLDLGRAGPKVRKVEDGVIESLDKLIKDMEDRQQQQQSNSAGAIRSSSPAQDSQPLGGKGPGEVTKKNIGSESDWGDLPPKEREEVMQQVGRDFPSHYRDVIEQYFRRMAAEGDR